jgi:hypothetical protein
LCFSRQTGAVELAGFNCTGTMSDEQKSLRKPSAAIWAGWAVAAILAVVASYFAALSITTRWQLTGQKDQAELASLELRSAEQRIEANRIVTDRQIADLQRETALDLLKIAPLAAPDDHGSRPVAIAVWNPFKQKGVLFAQDLPKLNTDESYQLWAIVTDQKKPVSNGVFTVDAQGRARVAFRCDTAAGSATGFFITRESKAGGASSPRAIVATGQLQ